MSPTVGWTELDYFRARDRARAAWQATNAQLELDIEPAHSRLVDGKGKSGVTPARKVASDGHGDWRADLPAQPFPSSLVGVLDSGEVARADGSSAAASPVSSPPSPSCFPEGGLAVPAEEAGVHPPPPMTERLRRISVSSTSAGPTKDGA